MKKALRNTAVATLAISALTLAACGGSDTGSSSSSKAGDSSSTGSKSEGAGGNESKADGDYNKLDRDSIKDGGTLTLPIEEISEQQNPFHADGTRYTSDVWRFYNPQVGLFDGDGTFHANPDYVTDVKERRKDGKTVVTYTINEKAEYNDGTPIDWKTFEHTWKFNSGENADLVVNSTDGYELIESVAAGENDKQAVVTFKQAYPWWEGLFNFLLPTQVTDIETFNKAYIKEANPEWGAGPYKVEKYDTQGGTITFVPNEKWWGDAPKLERVTLRQMESQASLNAFKAGEVDATGAGNKERLTAVKAMGDQAEIRTSLDARNSLLTLNAQSPILADKDVREAIMTGIDRSQIAAIRFNGLDYTEDLPGSFTLFQTQPGYEDNFGAVVSYDQDKAKKILDDAGWAEGADGVREKDGQKLELNYVLLGDSQTSKAMASAFQKMLKDIGVQMNVNERPSSDFSKVVTERDFDLFPMGFASSDPFGVAYFGQIYLSDSQLNKSSTGTPELDAKIRDLQTITSADDQIKKANELEKEAFAAYGIMPLTNGPAIVAVKPGLANYGAFSFAIVPVQNIGWEK